MDPLFPAALQYIREVQTKIAGDGRRTYDEFRETLKQYSHRIIDSSTVISTVEKLFHDHQTLLDSFKPFVPSHRAAPAPPAEDPNVRSCVDFINRVGARFDGGRAFRKFLDCMHAYARAEMSACDVRDKVLGLLGENDDLFDEFMCFLPESCVRERSKRRRIDQTTDHDRDFKLRHREMKRRDSDSGSRDEEETVARPRRTVRRRLNRFGREEEAAARRAIDRDNVMEDLLCEIDVKIENLKTCTKSAECLHGGLYSNSKDRLSPADVRLDEHFTPLNLACIRSLDRKFLQVADHEDMVHALAELLEVLKKKMKGLERERVKIVQKWNRIRQTQ